jgi:uncharacterized protein YoxC
MFRVNKEALPNMAQGKQQDFMSRLADRGEQVVGRITDLPGAKQLAEAMTALTKTVDDVQKRLRSLDPLEKRVTELEKRVAKLEGKTKPRTRKTTAKRSTARKPASSSSSTRRRSSSS